MRKRIYYVLEKGRVGGFFDTAYESLMMVAILVSIIPLMTHNDCPLFHIIELVTVTIFIIDYILHWITADYRLKKGPVSFLLYPFTGWAILDLLSILPAVSLLNPGFKILRITRLMKVLRLLKVIRYSDKFRVLSRVIYKERGVLLSVMWVAIFYIFLTALIMFNAEPPVNPATGQPTFQDFFDALYWAAVTLTTVGYGDMVPASDIGRLVGMLSSLFGVAIIALPSGVITASYLDELRKRGGKKKTAEKPSEIVDPETPSQK